MNAKRAKALRREAQAATVGDKADGYAVKATNTISASYIDRRGEHATKTVAHRTFMTHPKTTAGAYKTLKRKAAK